MLRRTTVVELFDASSGSTYRASNALVSVTLSHSGRGSELDGRRTRRWIFQCLGRAGTESRIGPELRERCTLNRSRTSQFAKACWKSGTWTLRKDCPGVKKDRWGGGKGSPELPYTTGHAVPRIIRSCKETWLVWFLNEPVS